MANDTSLTHEKNIVMTCAQSLWFDCAKGKITAAEAFESFCNGFEEGDLSKQVDSMPDEMLRVFSQLASSNEEISISSLALHAFNFDFAKAERWKRHRLELIHDAIQRRLERQRNA